MYENEIRTEINPTFLTLCVCVWVLCAYIFVHALFGSMTLVGSVGVQKWKLINSISFDNTNFHSWKLFSSFVWFCVQFGSKQPATFNEQAKILFLVCERAYCCCVCHFVLFSSLDVQLICDSRFYCVCLKCFFLVCFSLLISVTFVCCFFDSRVHRQRRKTTKGSRFYGEIR